VAKVVESVGERVRRLRRERGLSERDLASPGVTHAYVSRIENGARNPSLTVVRELAEKLGVTALYLETGSDEVVCPHCHRSPTKRGTRLRTHP
jgi:transcriptional regulator with XRE-family HTH domain